MAASMQGTTRTVSQTHSEGRSRFVEKVCHWWVAAAATAEEQVTLEARGTRFVFVFSFHRWGTGDDLHKTKPSTYSTTTIINNISINSTIIINISIKIKHYYIILINYYLGCNDPPPPWCFSFYSLLSFHFTFCFLLKRFVPPPRFAHVATRHGIQPRSSDCVILDP